MTDSSSMVALVTGPTFLSKLECFPTQVSLVGFIYLYMYSAYLVYATDEGGNSQKQLSDPVENRRRRKNSFILIKRFR